MPAPTEKPILPPQPKKIRAAHFGATEDQLIIQRRDDDADNL
jgi:hypothetical protein